MSKNIDERIVQMSFDNSNFEKNVKGTIDSLEKLDKSTEKLSQNISKSDLSPLAKGAEDVKVKWSIMQSVIDEAGHRIGSKIIDLAENVIKLINPFDNLAAAAKNAFSIMESKGWSRSAAIENARFKLKGLGLEYENLKKQIENAVSGTAYGLDAAASAAAQLSASGVKAGANIRDSLDGVYKNVDDLERALGAISGMAAVTGDSYEHMTDIFTSAAGKGKVTADTFNRISAQGTNAAAALAESMGVTEAAVREMASKGQISFQQFADAMYEAFYKNAKDSNKTYDGALANMKSALGQIGVKFADPIRQNLIVPFNELRTILYGVRDNIGPLADFFSKLCQVAKNFFSMLVGYKSELQGAYETDAFDELKAKYINGFAFLQNICKGIVNIAKAALSVLIPIGQAIKDLIPKDLLTNIPQLAKDFEKWTETLKPSAETLSNIKRVTYAIGIIFKSLISIVGQLVSPFFHINASGTSLVGILGKIVYMIVLVCAAFLQWVANSGFVVTAINTLITAVEFAAGAIGVGFTGAISVLSKAFSTIKALITGEMSVSEFYQAGVNVLKGFINGITETASPVINKILGIFQKIVDIVKNFLGIHSPSVLFFQLAKFCLQGFGNGIEEGINSGVVKDPTTDFLSKMIEWFINGVKKLGPLLAPVFQEVFERIGSKIKSSGADMIIDFIKSIGSGIKEFVTHLDGGKIAVIAFTATTITLILTIKKLAKSAESTINTFKNVASSISGVGKSASGFIDSLTYGVKKFTGELDDKKKTTINDTAKAILTFAGAIAIITGCLIALGYVPYENIRQGGFVLLGIVGTLAAVSILLLVLAKSFTKFSKQMGDSSKKLSDKSFGNASTKLLKLAVSMGIMAIAMGSLIKAFNNLDTKGMSFNDIATKLGVMGILMVELGAIAIVLSKSAPSLTKGSLFLLLFAGSVAILAKVFNKLPDLTDGLTQLGILALGIMAVGKLLSEGITSFGKAVTTLATAALTVTAAMALLGGLIVFLNTFVPMKSLAAGMLKLTALAVFVVALCGALQIISNLGTQESKLAKMGGTLVGISVAMGILAIVASKIGKVPAKELLKGVLVMAATTLMVSGLMAASALTEKAKPVKFAAALILITGCMAILAGLAALIGLIDPNQLAIGCAVFTALTLMVSMMMVASQFTEKANVKAITATILGLFSVIALMIVMSLINDWVSIRNSIISLGSVMLLFAATLAIIGKGTEKMKGKTIAAMAIMLLGIVEIGVILFYLAQQDWKSVLSAGVSMAAVLYTFTNLLTTISSRTGLKVKKIGTVLLAALALIPVGAALAALSSFDWKGMLASGVAMGIVLVAFGKVVEIISASRAIKLDKIKSFLAATLSLAPIGLAIGVLSHFDWKGMIAAGVGLSIAVLGLSGAFNIISNAKYTLKKVQAFVVASAALIPIGMAIAIMSATSGKYWEGFAAAGIALGVAVNALAFALTIVSNCKLNSSDVLNFVLASAAFIPAAGAISTIAGYNWDSLSASSLSLAACLLSLSAALAIMSNVNINPTQLGSFIIGAVALFPMAVALSQIAGFNWDGILASAVALGGIALVLSAALFIAANSGPMVILGAASLLIASLSLLPAAYALSMIAGYDWQGILAAAGALSLVTVILTACMALAGALGPVVLIGAAALIVGAAALVVMSYALEIFMPSLTQLVALAPLLPMLGDGLLQLTPGLLAFSAACIVLSMATLGLVVGGTFLPTFASGLMALSMVGDITSVAESIIKVAAGCTVMGAAAAGMVSASVGLLLLSVAFQKVSSSVVLLGTTFTTVLTLMQRAFTTFGTVMSKTASIVGVNISAGMIKGISASTPSVLKSGLTMMNGFVNGIRSFMGIHSPSLKMQWLGKMCGVGFDEGSTDETVWRDIKTKFSKLLNNAILAPVKGVAEKLKGWFGGLKDSAGGAIDGIGDILDGLENITADGSDLESLLNDFIDVEDMTAGITDSVTEAMGGLDEALGSVGGAGGSGEKAKNAIQSLSETIAGQLDLFSEFSAKTELTSDKLLANMKSQIDGISNWANMMNTLGTKGIDKGLLAKLAEMGPQGYEYVNAFVNMTEEQLAQANQYYAQALVLPDSAAATALGQADKIGQNLGQGLVNGINATNSIVKDAACEQMQGGLDGYTETADENSPSKETERYGVFLGEGLINGIAAVKLRVINSCHQLAYGMCQKIKDLVNKENGFEMGMYLCNGLADGIKSYGDQAVQEAMTVALNVKEAMATGLEEASPSKASFRFGKFLDMGLANGIKAYGNLAEIAAEDTSIGVLDSMNAVIDSIAEALTSDMDMNPTITPVLDLSNIQNGANSISEMFNKGVSVSASKASRVSIANGNTSGSNGNSVGDGSSSGTTWNFTQNNYSPKALSRVDIYRQTRNQLSQVRGASI